VHRLYRTAFELKESFTGMIAACELGDASVWDSSADTLRQQQQRSRDIVDLVGKMSKQQQHAAYAALLKSMEMHFASILRDDLQPRLKRLQIKFDGAKASAEELRQQQQQQQQQQQDDDEHLDDRSLSVQVVDNSALENAASHNDHEDLNLPSKSKEALDSNAPAATQAASDAAPKAKPAALPSKADLTSLFGIFGKFSRPNSRAPLAQNYGGRAAGSFNARNLTGRRAVDADCAGSIGGRCDAEARANLDQHAAGLKRDSSLDTKMPEYLEIGVLKSYADGFEAFLGREGQFTASEFVQWCSCDECPLPLQDPAHALAVGVAIVGQTFFEMVEGGSGLKVFDENSDSVWCFTGKWAATPVQWSPATAPSVAVEPPHLLLPCEDGTVSPVQSSPARRVHNSVQNLVHLCDSPAKAAASPDVIDDVARAQMRSSRLIHLTIFRRVVAVR
jgi:hypothetical protein